MHSRISEKCLNMLHTVAAPLTGLIVCIVIILFRSQNAPSALQTLFTGTFSSSYYIGSMLNTMALLLTAGLGASVAVKSGNMNLGGEGQIYAGGFIACLIMTSIHNNSFLVFTLALILSVMSGAALALISSVLKETRNASVLLTSFLVSAAVIPLIDGAITKSKEGSLQNLLALPYIPHEFEMTQLLPPSPLNISFILAVILSLITFFILYKTKTGHTVSMWGIAPEFSRYSGFSSAANSFGTLAVSGALHALTGFFAVCGTYYTCHKGFYAGMGWNALTACLIASSHPLYLIVSSLVLAWLFNSAELLSLTQGFGFDISGIVQGVVLFTIAASTFSKGEKQ